MTNEGKTIAFLAGIGTIIVVALITLFGSFYTVSVGNVAILIKYGTIVDTVGTGVHAMIPFIEHAVTVNVQTQKEQTDASAASLDLQNVTATIAVNFNVNQDKVADIYARFGENYKGVVIDPAIQEVIKGVTAKYTAEQLITQRAQVQSDIQSGLASRLQPDDINVTAVSIIDFKFSDSFNTAVEAKVTAQQNALAAQNKLAQVQAEAEQTIATAKAQAEAIQIQAQAINSQGGADYVALQAINKWNGVLPTQMIPGSTVPFIKVSPAN